MTKTCAAPVTHSGSKNKIFSENKVCKSRSSSASPSSSSSSVSSSGADVIVAEEMQELLCKLKDLVPYMPRNKKLSKLEIIQYVIDYIFDLQTALDSHPASLTSSATLTSDQRTAHHHIVSSNSSPFASFRQPLSTLSYPSL